MRNLLVLLTTLVIGVLALTQIAAQPAPGATRQFTLYVREGWVPTANGEQLYVWGFTEDPSGPPQVPGPAIVVNEGDVVAITLVNDRDPTTSDRLPSGEGHTIHLHGLDVPTEHDGVPETHAAGLVRQGGSYTYRFTATHAGTYFYHCHQNNVEHQQMGMYGPLIVRAANGAAMAYTGGPAFDREYTLTLADAGIDAHQRAREAVKDGAAPYNWLHYRPSHFLINDMATPLNREGVFTTTVTAGERTLVRVINAGYTAQQMHAHDTTFQVVASDGRPWPNGPTTSSIWLGPGEKFDLMFSAPAASMLAIHAHTGAEPTIPGLLESVAPLPAPDTNEIRRVTLYPRDGHTAMPDGASIYVRGYAASPDGEAQVPGPMVSARAGDLVEITLVNDRDPFGTGAALQIMGASGPLVGPAKILPGGTGVYQFRASHAGSMLYSDPDWRHLGLYGSVVVTPAGDTASAYDGGPSYDQHYTMVLSELDQATHERAREASIVGVAAPTASRYAPNYFLINGRAYPDLEHDRASSVHAQPGERILLRVLNAGQLPHAMHLHGYHFAVVAAAGRPIVAPPLKDTVLIGPGESYDLWFVADQAGLFPFHDHYETANTNNGVWLGGMHTMITTGSSPSPMTQPQATTRPPTDGPTVTLRDNFYTPNQVTIPVGTTVRWEHQGRSEHTVTSLLGYFDSGTVRSGESYSFTFTAPGRYDYFCRFHITNRGIVMVQ